MCKRDALYSGSRIYVQVSRFFLRKPINWRDVGIHLAHQVLLAQAVPHPYRSPMSVLLLLSAGFASLIEEARGRCENILTNVLADSGSASALHAL